MKRPRPMLAKSYPYYLANKAVKPNRKLDVLDKYTGKAATRVALPDAAALELAIAAAHDAALPMKHFRPYERQAVLEHCVHRLAERRDELAYALCVEAGKPINDSV